MIENQVFILIKNTYIGKKQKIRDNEIILLFILLNPYYKVSDNFMTKNALQLSDFQYISI